MPSFKVVVGKQVVEWYSSDRLGNFNPFLIKNKSDLPNNLKFITREWVIEGKDEAAIRRLYNEAVELGIENIKGFDLISIEEVKEHSE